MPLDSQTGCSLTKKKSLRVQETAENVWVFIASLLSEKGNGYKEHDNIL
jgi:hypothetical protein